MVLELRRLALLHRFAACGSISATAAATGYSASAVSQQLAVLETEAGVALLERTARSAALTDAGRTLAAHAATVLSAVEAAESALAEHAGAVTGRLVVSAIPTAAAALVPALVGLRREHPGLELVVHQYGPAEALARLRTRDVDVAVVDDWGPRRAAEPDLCRVRLLRDPLVLAGPRDHDTWLCPPPDQPSRAPTDRLLAAAGIVPVVRWEFQGLATIADLVAHGAGAAVLPALAVLGAEVPLTALTPARHRRVDVVIRAGARARPAVAAALAVLRAHGEDLEARCHDLVPARN